MSVGLCLGAGEEVGETVVGEIGVGLATKVFEVFCGAEVKGEKNLGAGGGNEEGNVEE